MEAKRDYIYLDHNATSVVRPEVCSKIIDSYGLPYNASAIHSLGREGRALINEERHFLAEYIDCEIESFLFTGGGTESNNIVLQSNGWDQIFCSSTEHESVYKCPVAQTLPVLSSGLLDMNALHDVLKSCGSKKTLVSVHWANNETGVLQPIKQISEIVHRYGAWMHADGVQILGKIPFSFRDSGLDFLSLSAHKMGGPQGVGALVVRRGVNLSSLFFGGGQERRLRAGTENVGGILGFGEAARCASFQVFENLRKQHEKLETELIQFSVAHGRPLCLIGKEVERLPNTTCLTMPGISNQSQLIYFDLKKIGVSIGSACSSTTVKPSRVLKNMGFQEDVVRSAIRVSSGWNTQETDFENFKEAWKALFLKHHDSI